MSLILTLFGGMILSAALYALGRWLRLSNFWAAVLAGLLPGLAYVVHAAFTRPGLDTITLHLVAYPTVAVLLAQLYGAKADHARTLHWAPKLMVSFFVLLSLVFGALVYIAANGLPPGLARILLPDAGGKTLHTGFAGVVGHHREAAKVIGHRQRMEARLASLGWSVEVGGLAAVAPDKIAPVTVRIRRADGSGVAGVGVALDLARPGMTEADRVALIETRPGDYQGVLPPLAAGAWLVTLNLEQTGPVIRLEHDLDVHDLDVRP